MVITSHKFKVSAKLGAVSALLWMPPKPCALLVLGHGAGADMNSPFMEQMSQSFADVGIATWRYQFPYTEQGRRRPDHATILQATVRAAVAAAAQETALPMLAGGKSMGGRMTSLAAADAPLESVRGLVFLGFPLQGVGPRQTATLRAAHLKHVTVPMLFLQGTRDAMAPVDAMRYLSAELQTRATLHLVPGADHGFKVLKKVGTTPEQVRQQLAQQTRSWLDPVLAVCSVSAS